MSSFLPSNVYKEAKENHMQGKAGRIVLSWNQFARNLKEAFNLYLESKQIEVITALEECPRFLRKHFPPKRTALAFAPYLIYLLFYSNYSLFRALTGLESSRKPNFTFLPWIELELFQMFPHRYLSQFAGPVLDVLAALPYLVHFPLPALFLLYLVTGEQRRKHLFTFMWCAGWVNILALILQYFFPTAPPWFVDSAVFDSQGRFIKSGANEAGFHRLDTLIGEHFFHGIYSASPLKFGAFPSLHVAWPAIILVNRPWFSKKFAWFHVVWIAWAAMYSCHHYLVDVLGGLALVFIVNFSILRIYNPFATSSRVIESTNMRHPILPQVRVN